MLCTPQTFSTVRSWASENLFKPPSLNLRFLRLGSVHSESDRNCNSLVSWFFHITYVYGDVSNLYLYRGYITHLHPFTSSTMDILDVIWDIFFAEPLGWLRLLPCWASLTAPAATRRGTVGLLGGIGCTTLPPRLRLGCPWFPLRRPQITPISLRGA